MSPEQQIASDFAAGYQAFARAVDMVMKIGDVEAARDAANKQLLDAQTQSVILAAALDKAKSDANDVAAKAATEANATIAGANTQAAGIVADAQTAADKTLNDNAAEWGRQKDTLDQQISAAKAELADLEAKIAAAKPQAQS